jgi:MFS family permease
LKINPPPESCEGAELEFDRKGQSARHPIGWHIARADEPGSGRVPGARTTKLLLDAGAGETGLLQTAQTLPFLLMSIPAGVLADRMSRARLMASAEGLRVVSLIVVLALVMCGALSLPLLAILGFVGACGTVAYSVAAPALVPSLVASDQLPRANGRIELARTTAFAGGPTLGRVSAINAVAYGARPLGAGIGALVGALYGAPTCLIVAAVAFLIQAIVILASPVPRLAGSPLPAAHDPS